MFRTEEVEETFILNPPAGAGLTHLPHQQQKGQKGPLINVFLFFLFCFLRSNTSLQTYLCFPREP